jgi:glycosyltransferase involved in cell wall biosynthesis
MIDPIEMTILEELPSFEERNNFVTIGNFMHEPNWDSVRYIKEKLWPKLSKLLPKAEMHVYGSYPTQKVLQLNNPKERFFIKGRAEDALEIMRTAKVCLAPLRFGAGIKGKFVDAMLSGTPSVTTTVGAESMFGILPWNGCITDSEEEMIAAAHELYTEKSIWKKAQINGVALINARFPKKKLGIELLTIIDEIQQNLEKHRIENFTGSMLLHHTLKSTEYMSRWIQEKNK